MMNIEQRANDMLQAMAGQRQYFADQAVALSAELAAAKRTIAEREARIAELEAKLEPPAAG